MLMSVADGAAHDQKRKAVVAALLLTPAAMARRKGGMYLDLYACVPKHWAPKNKQKQGKGAAPIVADDSRMGQDESTEVERACSTRLGCR